jgi:hypothetical protein
VCVHVSRFWRGKILMLPLCCHFLSPRFCRFDGSICLRQRAIGRLRSVGSATKFTFAMKRATTKKSPCAVDAHQSASLDNRKPL